MHSMGPRRSCSDACRLCDKINENMHSIFAKSEEGHQILHLIKQCLPLIIYRTDPLSKQICDECFGKLKTCYSFKKTSLLTANKQKEHLLNNTENSDKSVQLFLSCDDTETNGVTYPNIPEKCEKGTSTNDLSISCINCKSSCFSSNIINSEVELCAELHKAIADSLSNNKVVTQSESEKASRTRRRRSQAFYHELDDSLCSSLTEFTNTESSQCYDEFHSDADSYDSDSEGVERVKRRKLNDSSILNISERQRAKEREARDLEKSRQRYQDEVEHHYYPLSLMNLALNVVNKKIVPEHEPYDFYVKPIEPSCTYCKEKFKNSRLLALHEVKHIGIELGEKVDNPTLWHESRDNAFVRNKWLNRYDEDEEEEAAAEEFEEEEEEEEEKVSSESLLIPVIKELPQEQAVTDEIILVKGNPTVNGLNLHEYSKDERKAFYPTMKIAGVNKKFCQLCRYSFKDNWAIESHYFSLACYYTCRYCGMRFNKQRHRFDEHVKEHQDNGDPLSTKIYAASKLNNFVPRIIQPEKLRKVIPPRDDSLNPKFPTIRVRTFQRNSAPPVMKIKEEKMDSDEEKPPVLHKVPQPVPKASNQAYFCRKCYKVFFKLDEFNVHSRNCDYNQFPQSRNNMNNSSVNNSVSNSVSNKVMPKPSTNGELVSPTGRPMRHCVRETGTYRDDVYTPEPAVKEKTPNQNQQSFVCFICNTPFPTIYSRNSHMRIHKGDTSKQQQQQQHHPPATRQRQNININSNNTSRPYIKQEQLEPEVQIHESEQNYHSVNSIGTVSITPISKNPNQKPTINPNIMKLVQNNPHLTIKANRSPEGTPEPSPSGSHMQNNMMIDDKTYKCSSCWESFNNKSHLYFHKKNQCEGSKYPCPFCKKRFGTEAAYSSHIFYSHPE